MPGEIGDRKRELRIATRRTRLSRCAGPTQDKAVATRATNGRDPPSARSTICNVSPDTLAGIDADVFTDCTPHHELSGFARVAIWLALGSTSWTMIGGAWLFAMHLIG